MFKFLVIFLFSLLLVSDTLCEVHRQQCVAEVGWESNDSYVNGDQPHAVVTDSAPPAPVNHDNFATEDEYEELIVEEDYGDVYPEESEADKHFDLEDDSAELEMVDLRTAEDYGEYPQRPEMDDDIDENQKEDHGFEFTFDYNIDDIGDDGFEEDREFDEEYEEMEDDFDEGYVDEYEEDDAPVSMRLAAGGRRLADMVSHAPPNVTDFDEDF